MVASIEDLVARLDEVLAKLSEAQSVIGNARVALDRARSGYEGVLDGSSAPHCAEVRRFNALAQRQCAELEQLLIVGTQRVRSYRTHLVGTVVTHTSTRTPGHAPAHTTVRHPDGSHYPADAAWALPLLPPAVVPRTKQRTVGLASMNGRYVGEITSGRDPVWSPLVDRRLQELGRHDARWLRSHVEMKIAAQAIHSRIVDSEVVINHAPCGYDDPATVGCHQLLEDVLPSGYTLTVSGTTIDRIAFHRIYRGRGPCPGS